MCIFYNTNSHLGIVFDILYYKIRIDYEFWLRELYMYAIVEPWAFFLFALIFSWEVWSSAIITFLDEYGCGFVVDFFESCSTFLSNSLDDNTEEDFSDLPELLGDDEEWPLGTVLEPCLMHTPIFCTHSNP